MEVTDDIIKQIEKAFGLKLYYWQIEYIKGNQVIKPQGRANGKTFAYVVRMLLGDAPIRKRDLTKFADEYNGSAYMSWFKNMFLK